MVAVAFVPDTLIYFDVLVGTQLLLLLPTLTRHGSTGCRSTM